MNNAEYRIYELKFYLNARHYVTINGHKGQVHPHTWEFVLKFKLPRKSFVEFSTVEKGIQEYLQAYQNKTLNDEAPFDVLQPTVENMTDYFSWQFSQRIHDLQGVLLEVRNSETPTRTYIVEMNDDSADSDKAVSEEMDKALDEIINEKD